MSQPPEDSAPHSTGPPDRQTLRLLERHLASDSLIIETAFNPDPYEPRLVTGQLNPEQYPDSVTAARLNIRWFTTGDFSIHYVEEHEDGTLWECRWDWHSNTHNTRLHFHEPPSATEVTDIELPSLHPLEIYSTVLTTIAPDIKNILIFYKP
ncbi:hypothetical protein [Natrarchaeobius chitinivorans]|uniref:Uncharacterized protein n=1 Tax=Natrarchaeobius chitinivorans TaxID=1679083 RepID=A0A3N6N8M4_NATCH|nr:hypothetical protein [Natrarchaeobius chitinivorans]RQG94812.1 hypothetical protein EA473_09925 [Natrarchaeobius chitinivorans]